MPNIVQVGIELDLDSLKAQLAKSEDASAESAKKTGKAVGKGIEDGIGDALKDIKKELLSIVAVYASFEGIKKIVETASEADAALLKMNQALNNAGQYSEAASKDFQAFAETIQETTTVDSTQAQSLLALAETFKVTGEQAKKLTSAAIELSAATGESLETSLRQLGATTEGVTGRLGKQFEAIKEMTPSALKAGAAIDFVLTRFQGSAAAQVETFAGATKQLANNFEDVQKQIGFLVTRSPVVIKAIQVISEMFDELVKYLEDFRENGVDVIGQFINKVLIAAEAVATYLTPSLQVFYNASIFAFNAVATGVAAFVTMTLQSLELVARAMAALSDRFKEFHENVTNALTAANDTTTQLMTQTGAAFDNIMDTQGSNAAAAFIKSFREKIGDGSDELVEDVALVGKKLQPAIDNVGLSLNWDQFKASFKNAATDVKKTIDDLGANVQKTLVAGVGNSFEKMGEALVKGENVFEAFGKAILGVLGDIAIQFGTTFFLMGLGNLFFAPAVGAAQIAAGLALITLGGVLKALGGGGGGAGAPSAAGGGGGGGDKYDGSTASNTQFTQADEKEETGPKTHVAINVQGNILDRRQTGLELADAFNEAFGSNGAAVATGGV